MVRAICLGGADTLWDDVERLEEMIGEEWPGLVIACNDAGVHWPRFLDHWCSLHPEQFRRFPDRSPGWIEQRAAMGHPDGYATWARRNPELVDHLMHTWGCGSSGMMTVMLAERLGCTHAILCGIPMDERPHFNDHHKDGRKPWASWKNHRRGWQRNRAIPRMGGWVKSMSGWTREVLGEPTLDWLETGGRQV